MNSVFVCWTARDFNLWVWMVQEAFQDFVIKEQRVTSCPKPWKAFEWILMAIWTECCLQTDLLHIQQKKIIFKSTNTVNHNKWIFFKKNLNLWFSVPIFKTVFMFNSDDVSLLSLFLIFIHCTNSNQFHINKEMRLSLFL